MRSNARIPGCCRLPAAAARAGAGQRTPSVVPKSYGIDRKDVTWFEACDSWMGTRNPEIKADGEVWRRSRLRRFGIARHAVTNREFAAFISASGYRTEAERFGWSYVFSAFVSPAHLGPTPKGTPWWSAVEGAFWAAPEGLGSAVADREDHPVVHVSWNDALAFAQWSGGRLPTEAEWEHAARGGRDERRYPWGNDEPRDDQVLCNIWQGSFPHRNLATDGYRGTAPVDAFSPNPAGLYNCSGNVWEWCQDAFRVRSQARDGKARDVQAVRDKERTLKGGSYLCHRSYCYRYRIAARMGRPPDTAAGHTGVRLAFDNHDS